MKQQTQPAQSEQKRSYRTTALAGYYVANRKIPQQGDGDGNMRAKIGHLLELTEAEAKYPLLNGEIEPVEAPAAPAKTASKAIG